MSSPLSTKRHSLSHIMAQATRMVMGADAKLAIGPDIDTGWYYDIDFGDKTLEESKLKEIEKKMKSIVREWQEFRPFTLSVSDARDFLMTLGEVYKVEMVNELETKWEIVIGFYANIGKFQNPVYKDFAYLNNPNVPVIARNEAIQKHKEVFSWSPELPRRFYWNRKTSRNDEPVLYFKIW